MEKIYMEYGDGLFELALQEQLLDVLREEVKALRDILGENPSYFGIVTSGKLTKEEQKALITEAFEGKMHPYLYHFLCLLHDRGIFTGLRYCLARYEERYLEEKGIVPTRVKSAQPLSDEEKRKVKAAIEKKTGLITDITFSVDPTLVAGLRVETEGRLFDNSAKGRMEEMKRHLEKAVLASSEGN